MPTKFLSVITFLILICDAQINKIFKYISCYFKWKYNKKEIAHGSVIEWFYLIKSLFCYYNFIITWQLSRRMNWNREYIYFFLFLIYIFSPWKTSTKKRQNWNGYKTSEMKFYVFKTCLYFIFNIKLCWQRRFLPFNFFSFLFYCLQRDWKNIFQSLVILRKSWLWRIQQHGVQGMKSYFLFLKKLSC